MKVHLQRQQLDQLVPEGLEADREGLADLLAKISVGFPKCLGRRSKTLHRLLPTRAIPYSLNPSDL